MLKAAAFLFEAFEFGGIDEAGGDTEGEFGGSGIAVSVEGGESVAAVIEVILKKRSHIEVGEIAGWINLKSGTEFNEGGAVFTVASVLDALGEVVVDVRGRALAGGYGQRTGHEQSSDENKMCTERGHRTTYSSRVAQKRQERRKPGSGDSCAVRERQLPL